MTIRRGWLRSYRFKQMLENIIGFSLFYGAIAVMIFMAILIWRNA